MPILGDHQAVTVGDQGLHQGFLADAHGYECGTTSREDFGRLGIPARSGEAVAQRESEGTPPTSPRDGCGSGQPEGSSGFSLLEHLWPFEHLMVLGWRNGLAHFECASPEPPIRCAPRQTKIPVISRTPRGPA